MSIKNSSNLEKLASVCFESSTNIPSSLFFATIATPIPTAGYVLLAHVYTVGKGHQQIHEIQMAPLIVPSLAINHVIFRGYMYMYIACSLPRTHAQGVK